MGGGQSNQIREELKSGIVNVHPLLGGHYIGHAFELHESCLHGPCMRIQAVFELPGAGLQHAFPSLIMAKLQLSSVG